MIRSILIACGIVACSLLWPLQAKAGFIVNGDFQAGNTGFTTNYIFTPGNIGGAQWYDILVNPFPAHPSAASYLDHTFGNSSGLMMAVNEANGPGVLVWGQTVSSLATNSDYVFGGFVSSWVSSRPTQLDVLFNGTSIGVVTAPSTTAVWSGFSFTWNSGASTSATIELRNVVGADVGGDFALDDISLDGPTPVATPEPASIVLALVGGITFLGARGRRFLARNLKAKTI